MALKEFKSTNGIANGETSQGVVTTIITSNTATTIDTVPLASFYSIDYTLTILQGTKVRTSKVLVQDDGTNVDSTEYAITETGGTISGVVVAASVSSTNMILQVTVTDAETTLVRVRAIKNVMGVIQPYLPGAPTVGTVTAGSGAASVPFTAPIDNGNTAITSYTASSNPAGYTGTASSSPITVANLPIGNSYTFNVAATNSVGTGPSSSDSNSVALVDSSFIARFSAAPYYQFPIGEATKLYVNPTGGSVAYSDGGYGTSQSLGNTWGRINASPPSAGWGIFRRLSPTVSPFTSALPTATLLDSSNNQYVFGKADRDGVGWMFKYDSGGTEQVMRKIGSSVNNAKWNTARTSIYMLVNGSTIVKIGTDLLTIEWQKTVSGLDASGAMGVDTNDNLYFVNKGAYNATSVNLIKLNSNAELVWQKTISVGGSSIFGTATHSIDQFGNTFITSYVSTSGGVVIQPFLTKVDSDGNVAWARSIYKGNNNQNWPRVTTADNLGGVMIMDDGRRPYKINSDGSLAYARSFTWPANFNQNQFILATDQNGAFYVIASNTTNNQSIIAKFAGSGAGTGTYTYGTYSVYGGVTSTASTSTSADASVIGTISTASLTLSTGYPPTLAASQGGSQGAVVYDTIS